MLLCADESDFLLCISGKADQVAADINAAGGKAIAIAGDVLDPAFPEALIGGTVK